MAEAFNKCRANLNSEYGQPRKTMSLLQMASVSNHHREHIYPATTEFKQFWTCAVHMHQCSNTIGSTVDWTFWWRGRNFTKFPHRFLFLFISWFLWLQFQCQTKWLSDFPSVTFILGASLNWSVLLWDRCKPASSSLKRLNLSAFCCLSHFAKLHAANGNSLFKESCKETFCVFVYSLYCITNSLK